jgi:alpha-L-fucosidase
MRNIDYKNMAAVAVSVLCLSLANVAGEEKRMDEDWGEQTASEQPEHPGLKWFTEDKYAMFIHWGLYSGLANRWEGKTYYGIGEWIMHMAGISPEAYTAVAPGFKPDHFDAQQIVQLAKAAGMKTIVITAKHSDGFAMFDTKASDFSITKATSFKRDPMKALADACRDEGMRLGFYYSQNYDWTHPYSGWFKGERPEGYKREDFEIYYNEKVAPQVTELLTNYGPISLVWFDTPGGMSKQYSARLVELVKQLQPDCLINSRIGGGLGDYVSLGDMHIPAVRPSKGVWETVDTTNDSWSYAWYDENWKSPKTICERLIRVVARGGSYMLNVGPKGDGSLPERVVDNLRVSGAWIQAHAESIYGADASPFNQGFSWGDITVKGNALYVHVFDWPAEGMLRLADLGVKVIGAAFLHDDSKVSVSRNDSVLELELGPQVGRKLPLVSVVKVTIDGPVSVTSQATQIDGLTSATLLAEMARTEGCNVKTHKWMEKFGEWKHVDYVWEWQSDDAHATWDLNVLEAGNYSVSIEYSCPKETEKSEWLLSSGDESITFITYESGFHPNDRGRGRQRNFTLNLGVLNIPDKGLRQLQITPLELKGSGIGVKGITLSPYR